MAAALGSVRVPCWRWQVLWPASNRVFLLRSPGVTPGALGSVQRLSCWSITGSLSRFEPAALLGSGRQWWQGQPCWLPPAHGGAGLVLLGRMGPRRWISALGRVKPGGFAASPYKAGFCSPGGWRPSPHRLRRRQDLALPCFFSLLSSPRVWLGWKGVTGRPAKCLPSPPAW